jgi:hypothetical protein
VDGWFKTGSYGRTKSKTGSKITGKQTSNVLPVSKANYKGNLNTVIVFSSSDSRVLAIMHYVTRVLETVP